MTAEQVRAVPPEWTALLRPFERFFDTPESARPFRAHTRGLLSDLPRKTAEPIAHRAGTPPRNRRQFLKARRWGHDGLTGAAQCRLRDAVADPPPDPVGAVAIP